MALTFAEWKKKNSTTAAEQPRSAAQPQPQEKSVTGGFAEWQSQNRPERAQARQEESQAQYNRRTAAAQRQTATHNPLEQAAMDMAAERISKKSGWDYVAENQRKYYEMLSDPQFAVDGVKKLGATVGGGVANFVNEYGSYPLYLTSRLMELPDDIAYALTKKEQYNLDNPDTNPGGRDSAALRAPNTFTETADTAKEVTGTLGDKIIDTAGAAGNMMAAAGLWGDLFGQVADTGALGRLTATANAAPTLNETATLSGRIAGAAGRAGARIGSGILSNPGNFGVSLGSAVNSYNEALDNGATFEQAAVNGLAKGLMEYYSNKLFSGTPYEDTGEEKGYVTQLTEYVADKLGKSDVLKDFNESTAGAVFNWLFDKAGEGFEEVVTGIADPLIDKLTYNREADFATADELIDEFIGGVLLSVFMTGGEALISGAQTAAYDRTAGQEIQNRGAQWGLIQEGLTYTPGSDAYEAAAAMQRVIEGGMQPDTSALGKLSRLVEAERAEATNGMQAAVSALSGISRGRTMTDAQLEALYGNSYARELLGVGEIEGKGKWTDRRAAIRSALEAAAANSQTRTEAARQGTDTTEAERGAEARETAAEAKATPAGEEYTSTVTRGEDGKYTMRVTDSNGAVMTEQRFDSEMSAYDAAADLGFAPARQSVATSDEMRNRVGIRQDLRTRAEADEIGKRGVQTLLLHTEANRRGGVKAYYDAFKAYYDAGLTDADYYDVQTEGYYPEGLKRAAYEAGEYDRKFTSSEEIAKIPFRGNGLHKADYAYAAGTYGTKTADDIQRVAEKLGVEVRFVDLVNGGTANAEIDGRVILMEKGNSNPVYKVLGHEWTHRIQDLSKDAYDEFKNSIKGELGDAVEAVKKNYKDHGMEITDDNALDEAVADYAGEMLADGRILDDFIKANRDKPNVLRRMWEAIKKLLDKLTGAEQQTVSEAEQKLRAALEAAEKAALSEDMNSDSNAAEAEEDAARYSLKASDANYLAAVERGDMETAQRMVDEAAKAAGYPLKLMHGTNSFGFTTIEYGEGDDNISFWATDSEEAAASYVRPMEDEPNTYVRSIGKPVKNRVSMSSTVPDILAALKAGDPTLYSDYRQATQKDIDRTIMPLLDDAKAAATALDGYGGLSDDIRSAAGEIMAATNVRSAVDAFEPVKNSGDIYYNGEYYYGANREMDRLRSLIDHLDRLSSLTPENTAAAPAWEYGGAPRLITKSDLYDQYLDVSGLAGRGIYEIYTTYNNPLVVRCGGRSWNRIRPTGAMANDLGDTATTRDIVKWAHDNGYGTVLFEDVKDTGTYGSQYTNASNVYAFLEGGENLFKSADPVTYDDDGNVIPLSERFNPEKTDIRFSMKAPVEETDRLIAWHNIKSSAIDSAIELGGLAMPSFAVKTADKSHDSYGDISVIANKDSIDPQRSKSQRIFAGDAWTPVFPKVGLKISEKAADTADEKVRSLLEAAGVGRNVSLALDTETLADQITRKGSFEKAYGDNDNFKLAFLQDTGRGIRIPMREKVYSRLADLATLRRISREIDISKATGYDSTMEQEPIVRRFVHDYYVQKLGQQLADKLHPLDKALNFDDMDNILRGAREFKRKGETREVDSKKLGVRIENAMKSKKIQAEYQAWLKELSKDFIELRGVRNNKELYKPSGYRRSFDELYDEYNLENIVKAMKGQPQQGRTQFLSGPSAVKGAALEDFNTIEKVRAQRGRLISEMDENSKAAYDKFNDDVKEIEDRIADDPFTGSDMLADILSHAKTQPDIERYLRKEYGFLYTQDHLDLSKLAGEIYELGQEANTLPMEYFEAKVYRAFPFSEAAAVVVPNTMPAETQQKLKDLGANVVTYKAGDNADRLAKVNSVEGARFSLKSTDETSTAAQLMRENERLTERVEHFKGQLRLTKDWTADERRVRQFTRGLISEFGADLSTEERTALTEEVKALVEYAHRNTRDADYRARMQDMAYDVARRIVKNARTLSEGSDVQLYNEVRSRLQAPMIIDQRYAHDISPDKWGEWRNANRSKVNVSINGKGAPVDTVYKELSEAYPWLFPAEITNPADQVMQMVDAVETLTPVFENPYSADMAYAVEFAANAVLDSVIDDALQAAPTFADRKKAQIQQERKANWEYTQEMLRKERAKRDEQIKAIMDYNRESQRRRAERREDSEARTRLLKIARRLQNKKLPAVTRALLDQYIGDLDTAAKSITGATLESLSALRDWYEKQKETDPDFIADPATEAKIARLGKRRIADLSAAEVAELTEVLLNIENELRNERRIIDSEDRRDTRQMVLESIYNVEETQGSKKNLIGKATDSLLDNTLSPLRLLRRLTGYVDTDPLYLRTQELADGQRKMLDYQMRAERMFSKWANDEKFIDRIRRKERIKITGLEHGKPVTLEITPDMRMALYLHSLNDQNMRHISKGGVTIPDIDLYLKGDLKEAYARGRTVVLSPSNVRVICKDMSDAERAYARAAHDYFNGMSRDEVNATSEKLVGYSIAGVDNYFPIETDRNFTKANIDELKRDGTIEGMGFLKERVNASNAINLVPMTDVLNRSIKNHAKYVGLAVPVRNFGKVWGMSAYNEQAGDAQGLRQAIGHKWGARGVEAIENMITDLQSQYKRSDDIDKLFSKIRSNYAGAVLSLNLSVALKQAASYPTAAAVLGWGPLAKAMKNFGSVDLDLISKYTPLQWHRSEGFSTPEQGDIKARQGMMDKVLNAKVKIGGKDIALLNWIQGVDLLTTRKLWKASEYYVRDNNKDLKIGSEEYYRAVADVYNRVIEETQPNYTTMQRPQLLRSQSAWAEMLGMFKTQPFQNFNVLYDAIGELRAAERMAKNGDDSKLKAAKKNAANAISSQIVQLAVFAAMTALWGALRKRDDKWRDKEGNMTAASVALGIGKDMLSGAASMIPAGSDIYNVIESVITGGKYYGASSVTVSAISDALSAIQKAGTAISKAVGDIREGKDVSYANLGKAMENLVLEGSKALGVPAENIRNNVQIVMRVSLVSADGEYMGNYEFIRLTENMESSYVKGDVYDLLYKAYLNDPAAHRELYRQMVKDGFKPDSIKSAMEKRMKETQGVTSVNDLKRRYNAP